MCACVRARASPSSGRNLQIIVMWHVTCGRVKDYGYLVLENLTSRKYTLRERIFSVEITKIGSVVTLFKLWGKNTIYF